jgi:hypothetical protein
MIYLYTISGCWFGAFDFSIYCIGKHNTNWLIFCRGVETPTRVFFAFSLCNMLQQLMYLAVLRTPSTSTSVIEYLTRELAPQKFPVYMCFFPPTRVHPNSTGLSSFFLLAWVRGGILSILYHIVPHSQTGMYVAVVHDPFLVILRCHRISESLAIGVSHL